jgi:hypothetical protein
MNLVARRAAEIRAELAVGNDVIATITDDAGAMIRIRIHQVTEARWYVLVSDIASRDVWSSSNVAPKDFLENLEAFIRHALGGQLMAPEAAL